MANIFGSPTNRSIYELSDLEKRELADGLKIDTAPLGTLLAAALLGLACLWNVPGIVKNRLSAPTATSALQYRQWVNSSVERQLPRQLTLGFGLYNDTSQKPNRYKSAGVPIENGPYPPPPSEHKHRCQIEGSGTCTVHIAHAKRNRSWYPARSDDPKYSFRLGFAAETPSFLRSW